MGDNKREMAILNGSLINWVKAIPFYFGQSIVLTEDEDDDYTWFMINNINSGDALSRNLTKNSLFTEVTMT